MIKNIIFDLSEVIISGYHGTEEIVEQNTSVSAKQFLERVIESWEIFEDTMRGQYLEDEYLEHLLEGTNWKIRKETLKGLIRQNLSRRVEGTMEIIQRLKTKYNLILLSDNVKEWVEYIHDNNSEIDIFDHQYFSYEYGKLKSDQGCFDYILEDLQINPSETIFIDDVLGNIEMAKKSGITGILFKEAEELEQELKKRGILS